jgi:hypothetical protein
MPGRSQNRALALHCVAAYDCRQTVRAAFQDIGSGSCWRCQEVVVRGDGYTDECDKLGVMTATDYGMQPMPESMTKTEVLLRITVAVNLLLAALTWSTWFEGTDSLDGSG